MNKVIESMVVWRYRIQWGGKSLEEFGGSPNGIEYRKVIYPGCKSGGFDEILSPEIPNPEWG